MHFTVKLANVAIRIQGRLGGILHHRLFWKTQGGAKEKAAPMDGPFNHL
ncbi:hypothetical protein ACP2AV_05570 [Aliiroseovarius sp. PTFE2010]